LTIILSFKRLKAALCSLLFAFGTSYTIPASALDEEVIQSIFVSPFTKHYNYNPAHRHVWLVGVEQEFTGKALRGMAFFTNSFGQESLYLFPVGGRYDDLLGVDGFYAKWTAGVMYGYKAPYENKVPLNYKGFSVAVVPSLGYKITNTWAVEAWLLGKAAVMLGTSYSFK
jgi:hypothetical protein